MDLSNRYPQRRAFVTGAASGLGLALCRHLAVDGWTLGMADVDADALPDAADTIRHLGGVPRPVALDVTDATAFQAAADDFVDAHGGVDVVVNNAGLGAGGRFEDTSLDEWRTVLDVNVMGVVHGCRAFLDALKRDGGLIMNVASLAAVAAAPRMSAYNVSKAGVRALSETLYGELKGDGVHVCVMLPSFFQTAIDQTLVGGDIDRRITQKLMTDSDLTADDVAAHALKHAANDKIHILYPTWQSYLVWYGKRLAPATYVKQLPDRNAKVESYAAHLREKHGSDS